MTKIRSQAVASHLKTNSVSRIAHRRVLKSQHLKAARKLSGKEIIKYNNNTSTHYRDLITTTTTTITPPTTNNPDGPTPDPSNPCASTCAGKAAGFYAPECCATTNICL